MFNSRIRFRTHSSEIETAAKSGGPRTPSQGCQVDANVAFG